MKKQVMITLLAVLTFSILPGCGKSKNDGPVIGGGGVIVGPGPTLPGGGSNTLQMSNASGRVTGAIYLNSGSVGGTLYTRANNIGDRVDVYIAGTPTYGTGYTAVSASATAYLAQSTIDAFYTYCGAQPVVAEFYMNQLTGGTPGTIPESIKLWAQKPNGQWCYGVI